MLDKETKAYYEKIFLDAFDEISCAEKQKKHGFREIIKVIIRSEKFVLSS